jgi:hypothetical protein
MKNQKPKNDLNELREEIYKRQFWEYDYDNGCEKANEVLKSLEKIKQNPVLLDYVLRCLSLNEIEDKEYYYLTVHPQKHNRTYEVIIDKVFNSIEDAQYHAWIGEFPESLLFEKYSIKTINKKVKL